MGGAESGPPVVAFPGRLDRRMRLGPFASGRDALKFLAYAAVGAAFAPTGAPWLAVPVLAGGAVATLWRPGGEPADARLAAYLRYVGRRLRPESRMSGRTARPALGNAVAALGGGRWAAVLRTGGVPLAFLPPPELARRFELYRELLRSVETGVSVLVSSAPIHRAPFVPAPNREMDPAAGARTGYAELVGLLCGRRSVRQVFVGVTAVGSRDRATARIEGEAARLEERLGAVGVRADRLRGRSLWAATIRLGLRARKGGGG